MSLAPGTTYYYRVKAINSTQESEYSEVVAVTTLTDDSILQSVLPASNPSIYRINTTSNKAELYLDLPFLNEGIQEYKLTLSTNADFSSPIYDKLTYVINKNTNYAFINQVRYVVLTVSNLSANTTYYLRLKAANKIGQSGNTDTSFITDTSLIPPTALGTTNLTSITAKINWTKVIGATSYVIDVDDNSNFSSPVISAFDVGDVDNYSIPVLVENTTYYYRVRAKAGSTLSKNSNVVTFTTLDATNTYNPLSYDLTNPVIIAVRNTYLDTFQINWYPVDRATSYTLDLSTAVDFGSLVVSNFSTTETKCTFNGLNPGTVYYVRVKANNSAKSSGYTIQTVTTLTNNTNLSTPQLLTPSTVLSTAFVLSWVKRNYANRYMIQLSSVSNFATLLQTIFVGDIDSYVIDKLTPASTYYARIYALSPTEASNVSNVVSITTATTLPSISLSGASELTSSTAKLSWTIDGAYSKYRLSVYKKVDFTTITEGRTNFLGDGFFNNLDVGNVSNYRVDLFLEASTTYNYFVIGETTNGDYKMSTIGEFTTKAEAPTIQISSNGAFLEWTGNLTRIEVSTDRDFKTLVQGWHPRTVENTGSFDISALTLSPTCYYIRGFDVVNGVIGTRSNTISTFGKYPILLPPIVTKTTALLRWKKNVSNAYTVQIFVDSGGGTYIPISGHTFPVSVGDTDFFYIKDLTADTNYYISLNWFNEDISRYVNVALPLYFKTNKYDAVSEVTTSGTAPVGVATPDYDRFNLNVPSTDTYLLELSKRSDFLTLDRYVEFQGLSKDIICEPNTTYYARLYKLSGGNKTNPQSLTITTTALPAYPTPLSTAPTISSTVILNETEALINFSSVAGALGYVVELSETNTFNLLDKTAYVTFLDDTKVLLSALIGTKVYYGRVYAYNAHSISAYSNVVTIDTTP